MINKLKSLINVLGYVAAWYGVLYQDKLIGIIGLLVIFVIFNLPQRK